MLLVERMGEDLVNVVVMRSNDWGCAQRVIDQTAMLAEVQAKSLGKMNSIARWVPVYQRRVCWPRRQGQN